VVLDIKGASELNQGNRLLSSGILVGILFAPLLRVKHEFFNKGVVVLVFLKAEMTVDEGAAHKISKTLERHFLLVGRDLSKKVVDLVFEAALLGEWHGVAVAGESAEQSSMGSEGRAGEACKSSKLLNHLF